VFSFELDSEAGVLVARCRGFWSVEDAEHYCDRLEVEASCARRLSGRLRLLVDIVGQSVQSGEVMQSLFRGKAIALRTALDRVAVVQRVALGKLQTGRVISSGQSRVFDSAAEAMEWLRQEAAPPVSAEVCIQPEAA
jgi:hypothetical protein